MPNFPIAIHPRNTNRKWKCDSVYSILDLVRWMWEFEIHWWNSRCIVQRVHLQLNNSFIWKFHFGFEHSVSRMWKPVVVNTKKGQENVCGNCVRTLERFVIVKPTIFRCYQNSSNFLLNLCKLMFIALNCLCASFHCVFFKHLVMTQTSEQNDKAIFFNDEEEILHFHACRLRHIKVRHQTYSTCLEKLNCRCHSCCMHILHISLQQ